VPTAIIAQLYLRAPARAEREHVAGQEAAARWVEPSFPTRAATLRPSLRQSLSRDSKGTSRLHV